MEQLVFDTSAILNCGRRGELAFLLERLAAENILLTTPEVEKELWDSKNQMFYQNLLKTRFSLKPATTSNLQLEDIGRLAALVSDGELSVMRLASELSACAIIDEPIVRREAGKLKIKVNGTLSLLAKGRKQQWCTDEQCIEVIDRLRTSGFRVRSRRVGEEVIDYVMAVGEQPLVKQSCNHECK